MRRNQNFEILYEKVTYIFRLFDFCFFFSLSYFSFSFLFAAVIVLLLGLLAVKKRLRSVIETGNFRHVVATCSGRKFCNEFFTQVFWTFLCISQALLGRSIRSGYGWKDLFLLQQLSVHDANCSQKWWRQKWKKCQGSSRPVKAGIGVKALMARYLLIPANF